MTPFDPWSDEESLRWLLLRLKEYKELDEWMCHYIRFIGQCVIRRPSKGPGGEQGKDIAAIENESTKEYCSYVIKAGPLQKNLDGDYGIIKQMRDAMLIPLEEYQYNNSKRTIRVVYNGEEGYRGAIKTFEQEAKKLEDEIGELLLRPIERWDIDVITPKIYEKKDLFIKSEIARKMVDKLRKYEDVCLTFKSEAEMVVNGNCGDPMTLKLVILEHLKKINNIE